MSRVMVNRVWMHHFGEPLVSTPSDFGTRSNPPTHPELLDYLAWSFKEGWSLKKLHRMLVLSSTYRQASLDRPECRAKDSDNKLLWRMPRRRLDLESMRDSLRTGHFRSARSHRRRQGGRRSSAMRRAAGGPSMVWSIGRACPGLYRALRFFPVPINLRNVAPAQRYRSRPCSGSTRRSSSSRRSRWRSGTEKEPSRGRSDRRPVSAGADARTGCERNDPGNHFSDGGGDAGEGGTVAIDGLAAVRPVCCC